MIYKNIPSKNQHKKTGHPPSQAIPSRPMIEVTVWDLLDWVYRRQKAHLADGSDFVTAGAGISLSRLAGEWLALGGVVDRCRDFGDTVPADAFAVHQFVTAGLPKHLSRLVIYHACHATRPDWGQGLRLAVVPVQRAGNGKGRAYGGVVPVKIIGDAGAVSVARAGYLEWLEAVRTIEAAAVGGKIGLVKWRVVPQDHVLPWG